MLKPTFYQKEIVESVTKGSNVFVDIVPGCGKTTTISFIVKENKNILVLANTNFSQKEFEEKLQNCDNVSVKTIHKAIKDVCQEVCDNNLILFESMKFIYKSEIPINILIIDECHNLNILHTKIISKLIKDCNISQVVCLGNYERLRNSKEKYLIKLKEFFTPANNISWEKLSLKNTSDD